MEVQTVVVGFDGSANGRRALEAGVDILAEGGTVHAVVAYSTPSPANVSQLLYSIPAEYEETFDLLAGPKSHVEEAEDYLSAAGVDHKCHFIEGNPAAAILDTALDVDADMVIVGSRGLSRASRFVRGSVSLRVASHATTSFMVIHHDDEHTPDESAE